MKKISRNQSINPLTRRFAMNPIKSVLIPAILLLIIKTLPAQETKWEFQLGGGICTENVYLGSDDYYVTPLPNIKVTYKRNSFTYTFSILEGLGINYMKPILGFFTSVNLNVGETRNTKEYSVAGIAVKHNTKIQNLLDGTPNAETQLALDLMLIHPSKIGLFGLSVAYHPTKVEYTLGGKNETTKDGYIYSAMYMIELPATDRLSISSLLSIGLMDKVYADTWYSVDKKTKSLKKFEADAGLHSTMFALELKYNLTEHINLSLIGAGRMLLGDAKDSPFTQQPAQGKIVMQTLYHF